ncbi:TDT family transporter [Acidocella sp.]|uniref:TDT family transporter n=1 Tax=Acidocella sp. TaxID=50710 RepID=UPI003CFDB719
MFPRPFSHHEHPGEIVRQFTPNWFTVTMGTGVLALLLDQMPGPAWLPALAADVWRLNIVLFSLFSCLYLAHWLFYPRQAAKIFKHSVVPMFLGAIPMGLATITNGVLVFGHDPHLALRLWEVDAVLSVLSGLVVPFAMVVGQKHMLESMTGVWLLPIVACEVAGASGALLAPHLPQDVAANLVLAGYGLWALSVPLALGILTILFLRLVLHSLPPAELAVSSWLALGPLGTGSLGLLLLGHAAPAAFAGTNLAFLADVAQGGGVLGGLVLWAYGAWWLALAVAMVLAHRPHRLPFNMGWWGFTFPLGVFILATNVLGTQTGLQAFVIAGHVLTMIFVLLWSMVAVRTLRGAYHGSLFAAPYMAPRSAARL